MQTVSSGMLQFCKHKLSLNITLKKSIVWQWRYSTSFDITRLCSTIPNNGPDQILEATSYKSWEPHGCVKLQVGTKGRAAYKPISIPTLLSNAAKEHKDIPALLVRRDDQWKSWTYREYERDVRTVAKAFINLGLERFNGVSIMGIPSPEWSISFYSAAYAGGFSAGIYTTNSPEACKYIAQHSQSKIVIVQNDEIAQKFIEILPDLPLVKAIVQWEGEPTSPKVMTWQDLVALGELQSEDGLEDRLKKVAINQCCSLIYTSGTTGAPKGVMCSHDNLTWATNFYIADANEVFGFDGKGNYVSYLPLSHIAGQLSVTLATAAGTSVYFADHDAMQGSLIKTLVEVQPTAFYSVPRLWEKMHEGVQNQLDQLPKTKRNLALWALRQGKNFTMSKIENRKLSVYEQVCYKLASKLVLTPMKTRLGLSNAYKLATITAPSTLEVMEFFMGLGFCLVEAYGLSETMTISTATMPIPGYFKLGTVGRKYDDIGVKLDYDAVGVKDEGEICIKGRSVCMGYLENPKATNDSIDEDGWLRSGDLGSFDEDGFLLLTGRLKELIITSGGENIPPVLIEEKIKKYLPMISNCMVVGDKRHYLTMLLTLKSDLDLSTGSPLDTLTAECRDTLKSFGSSATTVKEAREEIFNNPGGAIATAIQKGFDKYNKEDAISRAQRVQKWCVLPHDFTLPTEELGNTLKLKRSFVADKYKDAINEMYK